MISGLWFVHLFVFCSGVPLILQVTCNKRKKTGVTQVRKFTCSRRAHTRPRALSLSLPRRNATLTLAADPRTSGATAAVGA